MSGRGTTLAEGDSFPKLLISNAVLRGARPAMREKEFGIWQSWTWAEALDEVRALACGLAAAGHAELYVLSNAVSRVSARLLERRRILLRH